MKTKIEDGEKTYWIGMTEEQVATLRFSIGSLLLAKETDLSMATAMERNVKVAPRFLDKTLMWETIESFEAGLGELAP